MSPAARAGRGYPHAVRHPPGTSVVIPARNAATTLPEQLAALATQTTAMNISRRRAAIQAMCIDDPR